MNTTESNPALWLAFLALNEQATRDWLTKLYNRRYFEETLADHIEAATRYDRKLSLVLFDIDDFKQINDTLGHKAGDEVLRQFADLLQSTARKADIVCRYGGDEFAVILPETESSKAWKFAERIFNVLETSCDLNFTAGGGVAALPSENIVALADADLLSKKAAARK
ncbi:MAG: GGDEF domain-containing protein [Pontiella sp.]